MKKSVCVYLCDPNRLALFKETCCWWPAVILVGLLLGGGLSAEPVSLFDGKTLSGWEGNTDTVWRVREGAIVGGSLSGNPQNEFLATKKSYQDFRLTLEYRLVGTEGFVNGGVQIRSRRIEDPPNEMMGYQADIGSGYSGFLYDESRRRTMLASADKNLIETLEKLGEWNHYEVLAQGPQVSIFLNGRRTSVWVEEDDSIIQEGLIALQIHGGCKAEIAFRNISIEEYPVSEIPPQGAVLRRFGVGQPVLARQSFPESQFRLEPDETIVFVGQENMVREHDYGRLEARLATAFSEQAPRFRSMAWEGDTVYEQWRELNFGGWPDQLETAGATLVVAQFGQMEAFDGVGRLTEFKAAYHRLLDEFAVHTRRLVLISPMPFEKPQAPHAPDLPLRNEVVAAYVDAVGEIAQERGAVFVDVFSPLAARESTAPRLTVDGIHLTESGWEIVAAVIAEQLGALPVDIQDSELLFRAIQEKNRLWFDCWRPANWSFVYGDRIAQRFGNAGGQEPSLQESFEQRRPMVEALDAKVHGLARGEVVSLAKLPRQGEELGAGSAQEPEQEKAGFSLEEPYQVNLFASEALGVVDPTQFAWDEAGRLYVACSPSYPQPRANALPGDYVIVLEDDDQDGVADRSWRFVEGLTMIQGLEPGPSGLYVCDYDQLVFWKDTDADGKADEKTVLFSGFGIGDTHQLINSICHGPDGTLWFTQGLHAMSLVETPWGISRMDRAGVWRLNPKTLRLEGFFGGGMAGANCWGVAFDDFGQVFHKTGDRPEGYWTVPGMVRGADPLGSGDRHIASQSYGASPEQYHGVGDLFKTSPKTTSIDIVGTSALPPSIQGTAVIGGYFGSLVELHEFLDEGSGFSTRQLPRLMRSRSNAFRPVDVSIGPDGAIYLADWYNPVIGHYQASYADPQRDKRHGRIWRISAEGYPSVTQPDLGAMSTGQLLQQLASSERWTRYQAKRLLFYRPRREVLREADDWVDSLNRADEPSEAVLREIAGVYQAHEAVRPSLLARLLNAQDFRVRAYAARMIGAWSDRLDDALSLLRERVHDQHPRVRLEAVVALSYLADRDAAAVATEVLNYPMDPFLTYALRQSTRALQSRWEKETAWLESLPERQRDYLRDILGNPPAPPSAGEELYTQACMACHQPGGKGLPGVYPPLAGSDWTSGDPERLIRVVLHGLVGPLSLNGETFQSTSGVPMPPFQGLSNQQIAEVLSFVRERFGGGAEPVTPEQVRGVRERERGRQVPWTANEL